MAREIVVVDSRSLTVNFDDRRNVGDRFQSLVIGQLVDELTGAPVRSPLKVATTLDGARPKVSTDGVGGLTGIPRRVYPMLDAAPFPPYDVTYEATGYLPITETISLPAQPGFPADFSGEDLGQMPVRRRPLSIKGRTYGMSAGNASVPIDGAAVAITGIWRFVEDIDVIGGPTVVALCSLSPGLYGDRPLGASIEIVALPVVAEDPRQLMQAAGPGEREIQVSRSGLASPDVLGFEVGDPDREEFLEVEAVIAPNDPNSPATVRLRFPFKHRHPEGSMAQRVTVPTPGAADATLAEGARSGDVTLFVDSITGLGPVQLVRVAGGGLAPEFSTLRLYEATSDPDGFYRLPEIHRVAAVEVSASRAAPPPALAGVSPLTLNYALYENRVDLPMS
jgi:hypothetical protein